MDSAIENDPTGLIRKSPRVFLVHIRVAERVVSTVDRSKASPENDSDRESTRCGSLVTRVFRFMQNYKTNDSKDDHCVLASDR